MQIFKANFSWASLVSLEMKKFIFQADFACCQASVPHGLKCLQGHRNEYKHHLNTKKYRGASSALWKVQQQIILSAAFKERVLKSTLNICLKMNYGLDHRLEEQPSSSQLLKELHGPALKI